MTDVDHQNEQRTGMDAIHDPIGSDTQREPARQHALERLPLVRISLEVIQSVSKAPIEMRFAPGDALERPFGAR